MLGGGASATYNITMPTVPCFHVDAFTSRRFAGNPAAVCLLAKAHPVKWMQAIAAELNLSETAFVVPMARGLQLRWFTPKCEVDLSHRLRKQGETWFEPASVVWHRVSASYGRTPTRRVLELQSRNEERVFWRNVGWRWLPRHAAVLAGKALRRWHEGTLTPWLTGRLRAWAGG